jgi:hypothetical protein
MPKSVAGCVGLFAVSIVALAALARAEDPKCKCPEAAAAQVGIPLLSKVPYISRLFKNATVVHQGVEGAPEEHAVFQFEIGLAGAADCEACPAGKAAACATAACGKDGCLVQPIKLAVPTLGISTCAADCACDGTCACAKQCSCEGACPAKVATAKCGANCDAHSHAIHHKAIVDQIVELTAIAAAAEAKLEAREESLETTAELLQALAELTGEKAGLAARLEAQTEHHGLVEKMMELAAENARLKAQVELAEAKAAVMQHSVEMAVENERLKMRLADLEERGADKPARTAARSRLEKKAR